MSKKMRSLSVCSAAMFFSLLVSSAFGYEKEIEKLSAQMAEKIAGKGKKTIAVVDFTDLEGNVTQLDQFIAEEFSVALAEAGNGFVRVIDRTRLKSIIKENKLAATGLIDPATASKLGKIAGVDALVTGTLTPFGDTVHLTVKVLDSNTADVIDSAKSDIAKTPAVEKLLGPVKPGRADLTKGEAENLTKKVKGIEFILKECKLSEDNITCKLFANSNEKDSELKVYAKYDNIYTVLYDNEGYKYASSKISIADDSADGWVQRRFIAGIPTSIILTFEGIKNSPAKAALFEVECFMANEHFNVQFRDIPISR